jgi:hypothetical protein
MNSPNTSGLRSASGFHYQNKRRPLLPSPSSEVALLNFRGGGFTLTWNQGLSHSCPVEGIKSWSQRQNHSAPEPGYVANKEADKRRKETGSGKLRRERVAERQQPPSIVAGQSFLSWRLVTVKFQICSYCSSICLSFPSPLTSKSADLQTTEVTKTLISLPSPSLSEGPDLAGVVSVATGTARVARQLSHRLRVSLFDCQQPRRSDPESAQPSEQA